jgi:hypothetical protein
MSDLDNNAAAENRKFAEFMYETYRNTLRTATNVGSDLARWVLTSLLATNGAAAVATWPIQMKPELKIAACALFVAGILLSLASAYASVKSIPTRLAPVAEAIGY